MVETGGTGDRRAASPSVLRIATLGWFQASQMKIQHMTDLSIHGMSY